MDKQAIINALVRLMSQAKDFKGNEQEETFLECFSHDISHWLNQACLALREEEQHEQSKAA